MTAGIERMCALCHEAKDVRVYRLDYFTLVRLCDGCRDRMGMTLFHEEDEE